MIKERLFLNKSDIFINTETAKLICIEIIEFYI